LLYIVRLLNIQEQLERSQLVVRQPQFRSGESRSFLPMIAVRLPAFFARRDFDLFLMYIETFAKEAEILTRYSVSFVFAQGGVESCLPRNLGLASLRDWLERFCSSMISFELPLPHGQGREARHSRWPSCLRGCVCEKF
jgi:hypothetical protein